ncbi:MAG: hypothetical protein COS90_07715 [Deltaproteobacteria bacterium CG07_land_8_20_14_0_80_60_11]|nr:MAG: hypothetical protein COS90_07715 [Deltaproteobacteria bacterium CG07_land_8_20_14_0_80_60_11]
MNQDHYIGDVAVTKTLNREQYVNDVKAAMIIGCSPQTLRNWRCTGGRGPVYCKKHHMVRYRVQDLLDFMAAGRIDPEARREG